MRFVGSLDSVVALCKGRCVLAGFHLPEGRLGREIFRKYEPWLKPRAQRLIHFVRRHQGLLVQAGNPLGIALRIDKRIYQRIEILLVQAGNPLGIASLDDIKSKGLHFINRQRGSGTRLALDCMMQEQGIDRADIKDYYTEEYTHLAVAAAIASGVADAGIGIEAAARRLKLDFIPLFIEDYYLLGRRETVEHPQVDAIVAILKSPDFAALVQGVPGYDTSRTGEISNVGDVTA